MLKRWVFIAPLSCACLSLSLAGPVTHAGASNAPAATRANSLGHPLLFPSLGQQQRNRSMAVLFIASHCRR